MKNIFKFALVTAIAAAPFAAEAKTLQERIAEDAAKDPYTQNEGAVLPAPNAFVYNEETIVTEIPPTYKIDVEEVEGHRYQKFNAKDKKGVERLPLSKKNNVVIPSVEY